LFIESKKRVTKCTSQFYCSFKILHVYYWFSWIVNLFSKPHQFIFVKGVLILDKTSW